VIIVDTNMATIGGIWFSL